ncbi:MAG: hypothetical protein ACPHEP_10235 [Acidimicrobiales bacterium]
MTIEDVADKIESKSEAIKKIIKAVTAAVVALIAAVSGVTMLWSGNDPEPAPTVRTDLVPGYGPQCSQLYNTIDHTWTESQWTVWENLKRDLGC